VQVKVGGGDATASPLHGGDGLFVGPLDLDVQSGSEGVHAITGQVETELIAIGFEWEGFSAAQGGQVHGLASIQSACKRNKLILFQSKE